nr:DUF927 domain-containing protein [uncultured Halomonas sp.]
MRSDADEPATTELDTSALASNTIPYAVSPMATMSPSSNDATASQGIGGTPAVHPCPDELSSHNEAPIRIKKPRRPGFASYPAPTQFGSAGLFYHGEFPSKADEEPVPFDTWICSPIECLAATYDERGDNHGLLLQFKPAHGPWRQWAMPLRLLRGRGEELRGELLNMGVRINPDAHRLLNKFLADSIPEKRIIAATRVGWHTIEDHLVFVMPRRTIAPDTLTTRISYQSEFATQVDYEIAGTLEGWRKGVGRLCRGNPLLVLAVSTSLSGPLLRLIHRKGVGIHLAGDSSNGKTTVLEVAASVWGGPEFMRTWRATGNGLEGVAAALSDTAIVLDEIGEADGREIGATVYALGNGTGKSRANRNGTAQRPNCWRIAILSSGECTLATHMREAGLRPRSGQNIRMLDIPSKRTYGAFDDLHHTADGRAFADYLKSAVTRHYGHIGPLFIEKLISEGGDLASEVDRLAQAPGFATAHPLHGRAAKGFALIGLAGELATRYGLTGWEEGEALAAAVEGFAAWKTGQGGVQSEHEQILANVRSFIERHGDARFSALDGHAISVRDRAGWWRDASQGRVFLFNKEALREALGGFDLRRGLDALEEAGWIAERESDSRSIRVRVCGSRVRLYAIRTTECEEKLG